MSTQVIPCSSGPRPAVPPPIPQKNATPDTVVLPVRIPAPSELSDDHEPNLWERTVMVMGTSFGVSLLLHLCVFSMLAFWVFKTPELEFLVIDSGVFDPKKMAEIDAQEFKLAPASVPKNDKSPLKSNVAFHAASSGSPQVDFEVVVPDLPGMGTNKGGGDGKGVFGSGTSAKSYVFVVDCSSSMYGSRFTLAISELIQTIGKLRSNQRFFVVFYSNTTMPLFSKLSFANGRIPANGKRPAVLRRVRRTRRGIRRSRRTTRRSLLAATSANRLRAQKWIFKIRPGGGTQPREAMELALSMKPQVIYFLTDGEIPGDTPDVVRRANKSGVIVNTVALEYAGSADLLKSIARENDGTYRFVK